MGLLVFLAGVLTGAGTVVFLEILGIQQLVSSATELVRSLLIPWQ